MTAAADVFATQGIEDTTVDDVVEAAGISRATFYRAFPSIDAVVASLYDRYASAMLERLSQDLAEAEPDALPQVLDRTLREAERWQHLVRAMRREELRPGRASHTVRPRVERQVEMLTRWWREQTGRAPRAGLMRCLVLLVQGVGLYAGHLPPAERAELRAGMLELATAIREILSES